jgi:hypothetical protein
MSSVVENFKDEEDINHKTIQAIQTEFIEVPAKVLCF